MLLLVNNCPASVWYVLDTFIDHSRTPALRAERTARSDAKNEGKKQSIWSSSNERGKGKLTYLNKHVIQHILIEVLRRGGHLLLCHFSLLAL